ncbi:MAG: energy-coupling factor transporter ATPase [Clostridia bacterium]|nr:energy-coupling factor transporter ATPase [Clostridia bacterium]
MSDEIIVLKDVCYKYEESSHNAVDHVSMTVRRGEMTAVLGRNGSGKSTLVKLINGLILPDSGTVLTDGMDTQDDEHVWDIRQRAGMVFQNPDNQLVATVVREDVAFGLENTGVPSADMPERIDAALKAVNMTDFAERAPHLLSGGQKQRVAIAGILAMRPDIMLFDEATAMLDPRGRKEVFETVRQLNREGMTVVWITHFMEEAAQCETVHIMHDGSLVLSGTPQEVFSDRERLQNWRLDVPPMAALAQRLRAAGVGLPEGILSIDDMTREVEALAAHL